jgi:hypothetical protein
MSRWVTEVLRDAENFLAIKGEHRLSVALRRLKKHWNVDNLQLYLHSDIEKIARGILESDDIDVLHGHLVALAASLGVDNCTADIVREHGSARYDIRMLTTYKQAWVSEFVKKNYSHIDPVSQRARSGLGEFYWDEFANLKAPTDNFLRAAQSFGIGPSGFSFVTQNQYRDWVCVSVSSRLSFAEFREAFADKVSDFIDVASLLAQVFSELVGHAHDLDQKLGDNHLRLLHFLYQGRSIEEAAHLDMLFGSVRSVENAILNIFGAKNITQAVAIAAERGLFRNLPYYDEDIISGRVPANDGSQPPPNDSMSSHATFSESVQPFVPTSRRPPN